MVGFVSVDGNTKDPCEDKIADNNLSKGIHSDIEIWKLKTNEQLKKLILDSEKMPLLNNLNIHSQNENLYSKNKEIINN